jgi:hypothetical protein
MTKAFHRRDHVIIHIDRHFSYILSDLAYMKNVMLYVGLLMHLLYMVLMCTRPAFQASMFHKFKYMVVVHAAPIFLH